ncbi:hypothetical protein GBAR_LOCUS17463 [Geodia barretti]|uniref:Uncharacterized protein n=1 Tax=Geodia barretti TaxID=519541 RepID=A0AA35WVW6_GEOBA|nr:hypothetical protein GBAR_LOCUS17463 [Geodia barretti]
MHPHPSGGFCGCALHLRPPPERVRPSRLAGGERPSTGSGRARIPRAPTF